MALRRIWRIRARHCREKRSYDRRQEGTKRRDASGQQYYFWKTYLGRSHSLELEVSAIPSPWALRQRECRVVIGKMWLSKPSVASKCEELAPAGGLNAAEMLRFLGENMRITQMLDLMKEDKMRRTRQVTRQHKIALRSATSTLV